MKKQLLVMALFMSSSTFACTMLQGTWSCKDASSGKKANIIVTQEDIANGVLYHITDSSSGKSQDLAADGVTRPVQMDQFSGTATASCMGSSELYAHMDFKNPAYGLVGQADISVKLSDPNTMLIATDVNYTLNGGAVQSENSIQNCTK